MKITVEEAINHRKSFYLSKNEHQWSLETLRSRWSVVINYDNRDAIEGIAEAPNSNVVLDLLCCVLRDQEFVVKVEFLFFPDFACRCCVCTGITNL